MAGLCLLYHGSFLKELSDDLLIIVHVSLKLKI